MPPNPPPQPPQPGQPTSAEICTSDFVLAALTMGVISPPSVATATEMSTEGASAGTPALESHSALAAGTSASARATALMRKSFTDTLEPCGGGGWGGGGTATEGRVEVGSRQQVEVAGGVASRVVEAHPQGMGKRAARC